MSITMTFLVARNAIPMRFASILTKFTMTNSVQYQKKARFSFAAAFTNLNQSIATSETVNFTKTTLIALHDTLHLPWFAEIALVTIAARFLITFPLVINQRKIMNRYEALTPEILAISQKLKRKFKEEAFISNRSKKSVQSQYSKMFSKEVNRLIVRDNCHPIKASMVPFFQIPLWIVLSHSYRNLAKLYPDPNDPASWNAFKQLQHEGLFWFQDLTLPDSTGILVVTTALINLTIIQLFVNERKRKQLSDSFFVKLITNVSRLLSVAIIPIGLVMPADMSFYWFISSSIGLFQNVLLMNPSVIRYLGIERPLINNDKFNDSMKKL